MMSALALSSVQRNKMLVRMVHNNDNEDNDTEVKEVNSIFKPCYLVVRVCDFLDVIDSHFLHPASRPRKLEKITHKINPQSLVFWVPTVGPTGQPSSHQSQLHAV